MSPKDKTDRLIKTQQPGTTFKTNNDKQIAVQCFRFALFCSRRLPFIPFIVFPVFILAMLNNANLFCFSRENRPLIHSLKILWRFLCLLWRIWRAKLHPLTGCTVDMRIDCLGVGHHSTG